MNKPIYPKPALTASALLSKLQGQGLVVDPADMTVALRYIEFIGAHRMKGYWYSSVDPATKRFRPGQDNFQYLAQQIHFDQELRALLWVAMEKVELAVRCGMGNYLSLQSSPHWFLDRSLFKHSNGWSFGQIVKKIEDEVGRSGERRPVKHYFDTYNEPYMPPSWVMSECVTLGFWSRTYQVLANPVHKRAISSKFGVNQPEVFESWLHSITYLRNLVAHHGQILGVILRIAPQNYKGQVKKQIVGVKGSPTTSLHLGSDTKCLHAAVKMMNFLMQRSHLPNSTKSDLIALFAKYPSNFASSVGFLTGWENQPGW